MDKIQDGLAVLINLRNDGQLPWLIGSLESIFGTESVESLYTDKQITITIGKRDFRDEHRKLVLDEIRKFDGLVLDEVEIYDHFPQ
ncbi:hypothetical protein [Nitrosopumilus sp.]|uniref:hypothetical protein n=1 Tax=Nitrosopumilus sp. TaxID=2024843 RepID=UPI00292DEC3E|nr:hypothetical protein [Nitrosopumilus sp.]